MQNRHHSRETADKVTTGGDNNLDVMIASYKPNVRCNTFSAPSWNSCVSIFSNMNAAKTRQTFGHLPDQRVQVRLPVTYKAGKNLRLLLHRACLLWIADRRCMVKIDITGQPTGLSWYEVWEAVVALASTCVRGRQKCGRAAGLGSYTFVEVRARVANGLRCRPQYIPSIVRRAPRRDNAAVVNW